MSALTAFFAQNAAAAQVEEVVVSDRFQDEHGAAVPWRLRSMTEEENETIRKSCQRKVKDKGVVSYETNTDEYLAKLAVASVVFPDLKNAELQQSYQVMGADQCLRKMLLPGEYATLVQKVQQINGFDKSINELADEVKN